jgi:porphobilinogen deaminase
MIYTSEYDSSYRNGPAIPVVELKVLPIGGNISTTITAMVDSGADATILPLPFLKNVGVEQVGRAKMKWGNERGKVYDADWLTKLI